MKIHLRKQSPRDAYPGVQFLGTVVDDNGMRGSLILNMDGEYAMVTRGVGHKLDQEAVAVAMAEAISIKPGPKPGGPSANPDGRPLDPYGRKATYPVTLAESDMTNARDILGDGNTSQGVRRAIRFTISHPELFRGWSQENMQ